MPLKKPKLMSYKAEATTQITVTTKSPHEELFFYLANVDLLDPENFWKLHERDLPCMALFMRKVFCVVASGSPVERVFSVGGNVLRPRRSRMSAKTLASLVFLKCNFELL